MSRISLRSVTAAAAAVVGTLAAGTAAAQDYGSYASHQIDYLTPLSAGGATAVNNAWVNLSSITKDGVPGLVGTGGFPGTTMWGPQASQVNSNASDSANLIKVSNGTAGGPYAASGGIYYGGFSAEVNYNGGTLAVADSTPIDGLANVVLQVGIGEAWTYDFYNHALPTLSYTTADGTVSGVAATFSDVVEKFFNGTVAMPTGDEDVFINQYALQWDLSGITAPITSFQVSFTGVQHAQLYGLTLTQSDVFNQVVALPPVPEPSTYALMGAGLLGVWLRTRRRRQDD